MPALRKRARRDEGGWGQSPGRCSGRSCGKSQKAIVGPACVLTSQGVSKDLWVGAGGTSQERGRIAAERPLEEGTEVDINDREHASASDRGGEATRHHRARNSSILRSSPGGVARLMRQPAHSYAHLIPVADGGIAEPTSIAAPSWAVRTHPYMYVRAPPADFSQP